MFICGDALAELRKMPDASVHCCVTSPPYWGLRDYGTAQWEGGTADCDHLMVRGSQGETGERADREHTQRVPYKEQCGRCGARRVDQQMGLEKTPGEYITRMVEVFGDVRRVLRDDGTLWLNIGDSYASTGGAHGGRDDNQIGVGAKRTHAAGAGDQSARTAPAGLKPKDLVGIPWALAFALRADGWYLRSDIIWAKPAPMPESVEDRPTRSHEYIFLLAKSERYYYNHEVIKEMAVSGHPSGNGYKRDARLTYQDGDGLRGSDEQWKPSRPSAPKGSFNGKTEAMALTGQNAFRAMTEKRNKRDVWFVDTKPYPEAHFATFPEDLIRPCILAGCPSGGTVLDPFAGAGTTGLVAKQNGCQFIGIELKPEYVLMAEKRLAQEVLAFT